MHSIKGTKTIYVSSAPEGQAKYFNNSDSVKLYSRIEHTDDTDCDMLLTTDDDADIRHRASPSLDLRPQVHRGSGSSSKKSKKTKRWLMILFLNSLELFKYMYQDVYI